jgi:catechol 2,3-dioxygenase-like lactoylglutathione lyase family enzyme
MLAVALLIGSTCSAQVPQSPWAQPEGAFFALSVPDAEASAVWYQKTLGFRVISKGEAPDKVARGILLEGHGSLLEIVQHSKAKSLKVLLPQAAGAHEIYGIFKLGLHVQDIESAYEAVQATGADVVYKLAMAQQMGMRSFMIRDNNGNLVQFFGK